MSEERYIVQSLTGHRTSSTGNTQRKPSTSWSVYDRLNNYRMLATYHDEREAHAHAERLNQAERNVREHRERLEDEQ